MKGPTIFRENETWWCLNKIGVTNSRNDVPQNELGLFKIQCRYKNMSGI